jgi:hypothetical protein
MNIQVQLVDHAARPLPKGLRLTLLGDGAELAEAETDEHGVVSFTIDSERTEGLSVRLSGFRRG